jgi:cyclic di-GMP phosphodiesterase Gmr
MESSEELRGLLLALESDHERVQLEVDLLRRVLDELKQSEQYALERAHLLNTIVNLLPVAVTVQAEDGRFVLVNDAAATQFGAGTENLAGAFADGIVPDFARTERDQEMGLICVGKSVSEEETIAGPAGPCTLLTSRKPVRVLDDSLMLSTSVDITERKQIESELLRRAYFDELTGLPNRSLIQERVEEVLAGKQGRENERFALAFIDIDNFKHINDYYSHAIGDALLVKVAQRVGSHVRASDTLARISGDEFVLVLDPIESDEQLHGIVNELLQQLKQPFFIEGFEVFTSASIGVSIYPEHGRHYEALRRNADSAMYRVKSASKGGAAFFDAKVGQAVTARMEVEQRLRLAIRDRRFCCAFQPKVDIRTQEVVGLEALVRLRDEAGEIQAPSSFVGLAVELGLIDQITRLVVSETIGAMELFDQAFGPNITVSVNVAAKQAGDYNFMRSFADSLKDSGFPERFMVEVTEDAFLAKSLFQTEILPMLREIGVKVSIDDFGTGYSSLSALADITADEIKVDRSFITAIHQRPRSQSVLKAIESLSHTLGMTVVAEGIETFEELAYLQATTRIQYAQGYYFAKPFMLDDFERSQLASTEQRTASIGRERADNRGVRSSRTSEAAARG